VHFGHTPTVEQYSFRESGFTRVNVCRNTNVAYLFHLLKLLNIKQKDLKITTDRMCTKLSLFLLHYMINHSCYQKIMTNKNVNCQHR